MKRGKFKTENTCFGEDEVLNFEPHSKVQRVSHGNHFSSIYPYHEVITNMFQDKNSYSILESELLGSYKYRLTVSQISNFSKNVWSIQVSNIEIEDHQTMDTIQGEKLMESLSDDVVIGCPEYPLFVSENHEMTINLENEEVEGSLIIFRNVVLLYVNDDKMIIEEEEEHMGRRRRSLIGFGILREDLARNETCLRIESKSLKNHSLLKGKNDCDGRRLEDTTMIMNLTLIGWIYYQYCHLMMNCLQTSNKKKILNSSFDAFVHEILVPLSKWFLMNIIFEENSHNFEGIEDSPHPLEEQISSFSHNMTSWCLEENKNENHDQEEEDLRMITSRIG